MKPELTYSELTGNYYIVTAWSKPGVAKTKYDVTNQVEAIVKKANAASREQVKRLFTHAWKRRSKCAPGCSCSMCKEVITMLGGCGGGE
jgi:hypothetical protein